MLPPLLTLLVSVIVQLNFVTPCVFTHRKVKPDDWDTVKYRRNYDNCEDCVCGQDSSVDLKPWAVYVHVRNGNGTTHARNTRICVGTIVASNLVVTSHQCLYTGNRKMNIYDAWKTRQAINYEDIYISTSTLPQKVDDYQENTKFSVKELVLSTRFAYNQKKYAFPGSDIAIIVLNETVKGDLKPICLSNFDRKMDVVYQIGYFYGLGGILENDITPEERRVRDVPILSARECDKERSSIMVYSIKNSLCIRFPSPAPTLAGGPLIISVHGQAGSFVENGTAFLVGLSSLTKQESRSSKYHYVYFSNVLDEIRYIERVGKKYKSQWYHPHNNATLKLRKKERVTKPEKYVFTLVGKIKRLETLDCECGILNSNPPDARISGGNEATPYEFGWLAKLFISFELEEDSLFGCGSSIINDRMIVTAAHCLYKIEFGGYPKKYFLYVRAHDREDDEQEIQLNVKEAFVHPQYIFQQKHDPYNLDADIGIIILENPIQFSSGRNINDVGAEDIRPICLPKLGELIETTGKQAIVAGWGLTQLDSEDIPEKLQKLELPILNLTGCIERDFNPFTDNQICAGSFDAEKASQEGDSGGPLIIQENGHWTLVGTVSGGGHGFDYDKWISDYEGEDEEWQDQPFISVFANVQKFLQFIDYHGERVGARWCKPNL